MTLPVKSSFFLILYLFFRVNTIFVKRAIWKRDIFFIYIIKFYKYTIYNRIDWITMPINPVSVSTYMG